MKFGFKSRNRAKSLFLLMAALIFSGCVANTGATRPDDTAGAMESRSVAIDWTRVPPPPQNRDLVAVAGFENKSTYSADRLWDTSSKFLSSHLLRTGYFRVVEWEEMKRLFDYDTLSQVDIVKSPENMKKAQRILLCEHFISGAVTRFNVNTTAQTSALSKAKIIDTTVRVDLLLQNAQTGEYLAAGKGEHTIRQTFNKGQVGSWDSSAGDDALDAAIGKALFELISTYAGVSRHQQAPVQQDGSGVRLN
jgi:curli biogenesis system outer membrane secretion channel CsgG